MYGNRLSLGRRRGLALCCSQEETEGMTKVLVFSPVVSQWFSVLSLCLWVGSCPHAHTHTHTHTCPYSHRHVWQSLHSLRVPVVLLVGLYDCSVAFSGENIPLPSLFVLLTYRSPSLQTSFLCDEQPHEHPQEWRGCPRSSTVKHLSPTERFLSHSSPYQR
jgi:hypothetical protein